MRKIDRMKEKCVKGKDAGDGGMAGGERGRRMGSRKRRKRLKKG